MRDKSDRYQVQVNNSPRKPKRLGGYLLEAGLLTTDQVDVALNDQQATGMRFGEVLVARGWLKEQTIEWVMRRIIMPEREAYTRWEKSQQTLVQERTVLQPRLAAKQAMSKMAQAASQPALEPKTKPAPVNKAPTTTFGPSTTTSSVNGLGRREVPIAKPLPPVNSSDSDVSWVG
ncbi:MULTISPECIES: hypothetical protein [unclassified Leptolyngbya]|uniref:hypothetical protein n=1 Tax=unclassified Leptolyngbya TaxID=2650499 RepID=UPI0016884B31|nr:MULTISPECIES: hypothetical protein [unclassified Leptolyngbya]MBD1913593.1 hypothetical protein [Leptolyngbya sp. FACHB-8]MBD2155764.1 hypothetical protein [Leptolyngbya sp. FACHB-16]